MLLKLSEVSMKLYLQNKIVTLGGSSKVFDENQQEVYEVKGRIVSLRDKKFIKDMDGNKYYSIGNTLFFNFIRDAAFVYDSKGKKILKIKEKIGLGYEIKTKDGSEMSVDGEIFKRDSNLMKDGKVIAKIVVQNTIIRDAYEIDVLDETDVPFIIAIVTAIDNIRDQR